MGRFGMNPERWGWVGTGRAGPCLHAGYRRLSGMILLLTVLCCAPGCGQPEPEIRTDVEDPAMGAPLSEPATAEGSSAADAAPAAILPTTLTYDAAAERIFVPGAGWFEAPALFESYFDDPAGLPEGIDLGALHGFHEQWQASRLAAAQ